MRYVKESRINATPQVVFGFHESPDALPMLIPPWDNMRVIESTGSLRPGSRVVLAGQLWIVPIRWVAVHTEYEPPHLFADIQESGPFAKWHHRHRILDDGHGGTLLRDEVEYELPMGRLGQWLAGWFVRRKLERMFDFRHRVTRQVSEQAAVPTPMGHHAGGRGAGTAAR
ncbi:MAG: SRPBCC family protein [Acidimicrobiia bacterium]|nr:SRPBCC family protein [Acidimicrobiia bacterium]